MPKGPEGKYIDKVHRALDSSVYHMSNTNPYIGGIPDIYYEGTKRCLWVEYKCIPLWPKKLDCTKLLTANQRKWLQRANKNHGNCAVIVGTASGEGVILGNLSWETIQDPSKLKKYTPKEVAQKIALKVHKPTHD